VPSRKHPKDMTKCEKEDKKETDRLEREKEESKKKG
jgi:hypothetical protein